MKTTLTKNQVSRASQKLQDIKSDAATDPRAQKELDELRAEWAKKTRDRKLKREEIAKTNADVQKQLDDEKEKRNTRHKKYNRKKRAKQTDEERAESNKKQRKSYKKKNAELRKVQAKSFAPQRGELDVDEPRQQDTYNEDFPLYMSELQALHNSWQPILSASAGYLPMPSNLESQPLCISGPSSMTECQTGQEMYSLCRSLESQLMEFLGAPQITSEQSTSGESSQQELTGMRPFQPGGTSASVPVSRHRILTPRPDPLKSPGGARPADELGNKEHRR